MDIMMDMPPSQLRLNLSQWDQMLEDVSSRAPEEACGLIAGQDGQVEGIFPITNALHSPIRFQMDPEEQIRVFFHIEEHGWNLLAIYHSHPKGPITPTHTDVVKAYYPNVAHLIWANKNGKWMCRGFIIQKNQVRDIPIYLSKEGEDRLIKP